MPAIPRFAGKSALVTGAASGIGRATARRLAAEGARVLAADVQNDALAAVAAELGPASAVRRCDVSDPAAVEAAVGDAVARFGALDVVVNAAGVLRTAHTHEETLEAWNRVLAINLTGTFLVCRAAIPHLLTTRGAIVNVSSTAALRAHAWTAAYSASKGGVLALTYELAVEYGQQGLRVNAVCPGGITTPIHQAFKVPDGADQKLVRRIMPLTGFAEPEEVAATIAFLASDEAVHITGTMVRVDAAMCT
ncbi:MAG TPA: SDR family NAD(P)-dependent oxidoreductase [Candidatus Limnocylindria bacterium]|nr:SDR family NAD(P)-dependent oxidoreductase [Candidatus Limnocylindria bacterium]